MIKIDNYTTLNVQRDPHGARLILQTTGNHSWSGNVAMYPSHVDGLIKQLMPFGTYGQDPEEERQKVRALLEKVVGIYDPEEIEAARGYRPTESNVALATRAAEVVKNVCAREKKLQEAHKEYHRKIGELEQEKRNLEKILASAGLDPALTVEGKIALLITQRKAAQRALSGE